MRPSASLSIRAAMLSKMRSARCVGCAKLRVRVRMRKSDVLSFRTTLRPARPLRASWAATRSQARPATSRSVSAEPVSWRNVVSAEMLLVGRSGVTLRSSSPWAKCASRWPNLPKRATSACSGSACRSAMVLSPLSSMRRAVTAPTPWILRTDSGAKKALRLGLADDGEAARLLQLGGQLGEELVAGEADGNGDADLALDAGGDQRQRLGSGRGLGAVVVGEVEIGFIERDRLDDGGGGAEDGADVGADALVLRHVGRHDGGMRAQLQRLEHRHGRAGAELARDVAGGDAPRRGRRDGR